MTNCSGSTEPFQLIVSRNHKQQRKEAAADLNVAPVTSNAAVVTSIILSFSFKERELWVFLNLCLSCGENESSANQLPSAVVVRTPF